jgi:hypothetical protein
MKKRAMITLSMIFLTACITSSVYAQFAQGENQVEEYSKATWDTLTYAEKFTYVLGYMGGIYAFEQVAFMDGRPSDEVQSIYNVLRSVIYSYASLIIQEVDEYYDDGGTLPLWRLIVVIAQDVSQFTPGPEERLRGGI